MALGGWNDSEGSKYSRMVATKASRKKFIDSALQFIEKYGFEGLDLDWEYPVCWQVLHYYEFTKIPLHLKLLL